ncbi:MAG: hypothetical protein IT462_13685 [Planctomycetes bacterium]|nr:hypothetical protein [Planctomycetota bacterium]
MVLFSKEKTDITTYFQGQDYVDMKDADAIFVAIPYTTDRTPAPGANETIVPSNKLMGDNPARDYKIRVGEEAVLVLDSFGNFDDIGVKFSKKPTSKELKEAFSRMPAKVESLSKKLQKNVDAANTALGKGDRNSAFKAAVKVLESGLVGYGACAEATKIYHSICDEVMGDIAVLKDGDAKEAEKKLGELAGVFTKRAAPSVYAEIDAAKKALKAAK